MVHQRGWVEGLEADGDSCPALPTDGEGVQYEAGLRQAERLTFDVRFDGTDGVVAPGTKPLAHQINGDEPLPEKKSPRFVDTRRETTTSQPTGST